MHKIIQLIGVERTKTYTRTHAILDDGSEVTGYGDDFKVGDEVMSYWDEQWQQHKMEKRFTRLIHKPRKNVVDDSIVDEYNG